MGETHVLIEGHFKLLFIFSPSVNEPIVCNSGGFFTAPWPQLCWILRLLSLSVWTPHSSLQPAGLTLLD